MGVIIDTERTSILSGILICKYRDIIQTIESSPVARESRGSKEFNLHPITLLNTFRKVLSLIVLKRIRRNVDPNQGLNQSGF